MSELMRILFTLEARSQEQEVGWQYLKRITSRDGKVTDEMGRLRQTSRRKDESPGGSQPPAECICKGDSGFWLLTPGFYPAAFGGISRAQPLPG
jgi:hypothetical protein